MIPSEYQCERFLLLVVAVLAGSLAQARADEPAKAFHRPQYEIVRTGTPIKIDGQLDEPAWLAAPEVGIFHFPWFKEGAREQSVAKLLWDDQNLYVGHVCQDAHITARDKQRDGAVAKDDCFEVMIVPDPDRPDFYYNVEWNVIGGYVDNHRPLGATGPREKWDASGVRIAGKYVGTLNKDDDQDEYWVVEVAIPLSNFAKVMKNSPPRPGDAWHLNFNRHGGDTNMQYSQWSPGDTPAPAFHTPHRFGRVTFSDRVSPFRLHKDD